MLRPKSRKDSKQCKRILRSSQKQNMDMNPKKIQNKLQKDEYYDKYMKYLISYNSEYFQNKMTLSKSNSRQVNFRFPSYAGSTIYQKDFKMKKVARNSDDRNINKCNLTADSIKFFVSQDEKTYEDKVDNRTTYQKDFIPRRAETACNKRKYKKCDTQEDENAPRFLQTHNKTEFLNWAGKNYVPSMKPSEKSAVTNVPFEAKSVYRTEFYSKAGKASKLLKREPSLQKVSNFRADMKTSYSKDFSHKENNFVRNDCKSAMTKRFTHEQPFKGKTEYRSEFIDIPINEDEKFQKKTVSQIQTFVMDL